MALHQPPQPRSDPVVGYSYRGIKFADVRRNKIDRRMQRWIGPGINPRAALGDKGYDSKSNRDAARQRGICPVIPYRSNVKDKSTFFPKVLYKSRARIEQAVGKLKGFKRIALRCEKTAQNYGSFVALTCAFILIKSVHKPSIDRAG